MSDIKYAVKTTQKDIDDFYKVIYGVKQINNEEEKQEFEAWYFAMCLLLPKDSFLDKVEHLGGMGKVISDSTKKREIAGFFRVEPRLVMARIKDLLSQDNQEQSEVNKTAKVITKKHQNIYN